MTGPFLPLAAGDRDSVVLLRLPPPPAVVDRFSLPASSAPPDGNAPRPSLRPLVDPNRAA